MYKMYLISAEGYKNANVGFLTIKTTSEIWVNMKDVGSGMGVKNISDLVLKEIYGIYKTKNPTKKQVNEYKMTKKEIYKNLTNYSKKIQVDENGCKYILFRIDIYFSECFLAVEIDEKGHTDREIIFEEKRQKALEKKLGCKFIRTNTSNAKNGYHLDYEVGNVQAFFDEFKNKKIKKLEGKIKEKEEKSNKK